MGPLINVTHAFHRARLASGLCLTNAFLVLLGFIITNLFATEMGCALQGRPREQTAAIQFFAMTLATQTDRSVCLVKVVVPDATLL